MSVTSYRLSQPALERHHHHKRETGPTPRSPAKMGSGGPRWSPFQDDHRAITARASRAVWFTPRFLRPRYGRPWGMMKESGHDCRCIMPVTHTPSPPTESSTTISYVRGSRPPDRHLVPESVPGGSAYPPSTFLHAGIVFK